MASYEDLTGRYSSIFDGFDILPGQNEFFMGMSNSSCEDDCDGFCPECTQMKICDAYKELKDEWDSFYM